MRTLKIILLILFITIYIKDSYADDKDYAMLTREALEELYRLSPEKNREVDFFQKLSESLKKKGNEVVKVIVVTPNGKSMMFRYNLKDYTAELVDKEDQIKDLYPFRVTYWEKTCLFKLSIANVDYNFTLDSSQLIFKSSNAFGALPNTE